MTTLWFTRLAGALALLLAAAGCATPPPAPSSDELPFDEAVARATDALAAQTHKLPAFIAKLEAKVNPRAVLIDPMLDAASGQQTALTRRLDDAVSLRLGAEPNAIGVLPFKQANVAKAQHLLTGTLTRVEAASAKPPARAPLQIDLSLTDMKTGTVVAQASARARDDGLDTTPTPYYQDSPVLVIDKVVEGYVRTAKTAPGQPADRDYFGRIAAAMLIADAATAYNAGRYEQAIELYRSALATPAGDQLRTLNGVYLASWKLGRASDAEAAFGRVVEFGIANHNLGVKFLFNPNTTDFWSDPKISGPYPIWLRQIARHAAASKVCMDVVGHTSRTGSEAWNDKLSEARAFAIRGRLGAEAAELAGRTKASGVGWRQNLIGTGTDDASDALDRRVEFRVAGC